MIDLFVGLFIASQTVYLLINLIGLVTIHAHRTRYVSKAEPDSYRELNVLIPLHGEDRDVVEETLDSVYASDYPTSLQQVYAIYEHDDEVVAQYVEDIDAEPVRVDTNDDLWQRITGLPTARTPLTRNKARALTYALYTLNLEGVVTILDSDTQFSEGLFRRGVAGLDEYDITQAKQTVRNINDGLLPLWESMGIAAWSHAIYAKTARGPYQLLGKGYFLTAETLYDLKGWNPADPTEDMALGMEAYSRGYRLGIIDEFVQDLCPPNFRAWVRQKRRWVGGPYRAINQAQLTLREALRFGAFTGVNQLVSVNHVFGVPAGIAMLYLVLSGSNPLTSPIVTAIIGLNLIFWIYYSFKTYQATRLAVRFRNFSQKLRYYILSNPITQVIYATLWIVPIGLFLFGSKQRRTAFETTPKRVEQRRGGQGSRRRKRTEVTTETTVDADEQTPVPTTFELYRDKASKWRWRFVHKNGNILADSGQGYQRKAGALRGLQSVRRNARSAPLRVNEGENNREEGVPSSHETIFDLYKDKAGKWRWRFVHKNGNIVADSGQGYQRKEGANTGIERIQENAHRSQIVGVDGSAMEADAGDGLEAQDSG